MVAEARTTLEMVTAAIDPGLAASGRLAWARAEAQVALETAHVVGITAVPWSDTRLSMATENCTLWATENCTLRGDTSRAERTFSR